MRNVTSSVPVLSCTAHVMGRKTMSRVLKLYSSVLPPWRGLNSLFKRINRFCQDPRSKRQGYSAELWSLVCGGNANCRPWKRAVYIEVLLRENISVFSGSELSLSPFGPLPHSAAMPIICFSNLLRIHDFQAAGETGTMLSSYVRVTVSRIWCSRYCQLYFIWAKNYL